MTTVMHPALYYILGALLLPFIRVRHLQQAAALLIPVAALTSLLLMKHEVYWQHSFLGYELVFGRVDKLAMVFALVFVIISFIAMVYAIHIREVGQHVAAYLYVGSTLLVVFAGDLFTLFVGWEIMAAASVFLIWYNRTRRSLEAGFRYAMVHLFGGAVLLAGIVLQVAQTGSTAFTVFDPATLAGKFILLGFIINAAVPPLHAWLPDAYPEGTITGSVFMTAFTTKSAVYVLARSFAGTELLVWLGAIMTLYGVYYAVLEKDIRRLLAYHIVSQVGYMVCGVGMGTEMAINGATAHAFCHILYKALLFMGMGAIIHVTGRRSILDLQGRNLYRRMPITLALYMVGAFSISAVPLFNGFVSKTMVVAAAGHDHRPLIELMLHLASVGTFLSVGLKLPWGAWFGKPREGHVHELAEAGEPPFNMLLAMGLAAALCIITGIQPQLLYHLLPHPVHFHPYEAHKVVAGLQLLVLTVAGFWIFLDKLMAGKPAITLDTDWFYRLFGRAMVLFCTYPLNRFRLLLQAGFADRTREVGRLSGNPYNVLEIFWISLLGKEPPALGKLLQKPFYEDRYRMPVGLGVCTALIFLFVFGLVYIRVAS
ncbi:MAG: Na(+)/H(+) antiporter subunit D [Deltaproteobacteria bacterium]|nr:Na(+)/H(+) antiporter subunit D [Candidatus Anaeroferrophillacea bacterium]